MSFLRRNSTTALFCSYHRKIISHSDGHSVVNQQNKKPIHRDIKNRREHCSRFKMTKLCIGFEFQRRGICLLTNHAGRQCGIGWCDNYRLPLPLLTSEFHFVFSCRRRLNCHKYIIQNKRLAVKWQIEYLGAKKGILYSLKKSPP